MPRPPPPGLPLLLLPLALLVAAAAPAPPPSRAASEPPPAALSAAPNSEAGSPGPAPGWTRNASDGTGTSSGGVHADARSPPPRTQRALTVLVLASGALIVYFVVRTVRLRRRNRKTRRYGVLDTNIENMELTPLEQDDDEDDTTLFDANHPRR